MIPDEIKKMLYEFYQNYLKLYLMLIGVSLTLLILAGASILFLGRDNIIEEDIEKVVEKEVETISSSGS